MGSVRERLLTAEQLSANRRHLHDCSVVLVGDCRVGKTALANRFINDKFSEGYRATSFEKLSTSAVVANKRVKFTIWDTTDSNNTTSSRTLAYREADVFLLCYKISDPSTLFSALNRWCHEVRIEAPSTPIILVGCQSDMRNDRDSLSSLAKHGKAPVSSDQALTFSQKMSALLYVETTSRMKSTATSAFEIAALASMGKLRPKGGKSLLSTPSPRFTKKQRFSSISPADSLERSEEEMEVLRRLEPSEQFWDQFQLPQQQQQSPQLTRSHSECPKTPSLGGSSRSASLSSSKTRSSSTSIPSISSLGGAGSKTPKNSRRMSRGQQQQEKMITIKCQRLTADKTYEEIEVEVPAPIYETIQLCNETGGGGFSARTKERRSFGHKLRNLFIKSTT